MKEHSNGEERAAEEAKNDLLEHIVRFIMYFRSKFLESSKPIHFWNPWSIGFPKNNVGICADTTMATNFGFSKWPT